MDQRKTSAVLFLLDFYGCADKMKCTEEKWLKNLYGKEYEEYAYNTGFVALAAAWVCTLF